MAKLEIRLGSFANHVAAFVEQTWKFRTIWKSRFASPVRIKWRKLLILARFDLRYLKDCPSQFFDRPRAARLSQARRPFHFRVRIMLKTDLSALYRDYIACLNQQNWPELKNFVHEDVSHNGRRIGISGYREMLEQDFQDIPDLHFTILLLMCDPPYIACRLGFDCTPKGNFLGLDVNGKRVSFTENVFYEFRQGKIVQVWSVIDKATIEAQI
jgi:predicted ester cyclase